MAKSIIVYGPQGCGKTINAPKLLKAFGLQQSRDLDDLTRSMRPKAEGMLYFAVEKPTAYKAHGLEAIDFEQAMWIANKPA